jgi:hypothetical protein
MARGCHMRVTGSVVLILLTAGAVPGAMRAQAALGGRPEAVVAAAYARAVSDTDIAGGLELISPTGLDTLLDLLLRDHKASEVAAGMLGLPSQDTLPNVGAVGVLTRLLESSPTMPTNVLAFGGDSVTCVNEERAYRTEEQIVCLVGTRDSAWVAVPGRLQAFVKGLVAGSSFH